MHQTPYLFQQLCVFLDRSYFDFLVKKYGGNRYVKHYSCWNHLLTMLWAQLTSRKSLRDIEYSLRAHPDKTYRMGFGRSVSRSTIALANASRDVAIYRETAVRMMNNVSAISVNKSELSELFGGLAVAGLFAVDSSIVHLPLLKFPWSVPQRNGGGIKLHTMFDILRNIPVTCLVTGNEERDQTFMDDYSYSPGCMYLFDKAYVKTDSLYKINRTGAYFVVRRKENMCIEVLTANFGIPKGNDEYVLSDDIIRFTSRRASNGYPDNLRMINYYSAENNRTLCFFTNNFKIPADMAAYVYKNRWIIEVFFKWVKQHLNIESFYGCSANAVSIQIYTAVIAYCLLARIADQFALKCSIYELSRALGVSLTEKIYLVDWVKTFNKNRFSGDSENVNPSLFD